MCNPRKDECKNLHFNEFFSPLFHQYLSDRVRILNTLAVLFYPTSPESTAFFNEQENYQKGGKVIYVNPRNLWITSARSQAKKKVEKGNVKGDKRRINVIQNVLTEEQALKPIFNVDGRTPLVYTILLTFLGVLPGSWIRIRIART